MFLYIHREQEIDFTALLPEELETCGTIINQDDKEYGIVKDWLRENKNGWVLSPITYVQFKTYYSNKLHIIVNASGVIINYSIDGEDWNQVVNSKPMKGIKYKCDNLLHTESRELSTEEAEKYKADSK